MQMHTHLVHDCPSCSSRLRCDENPHPLNSSCVIRSNCATRDLPPPQAMGCDGGMLPDIKSARGTKKLGDHRAGVLQGPCGHWQWNLRSGLCDLNPSSVLLLDFTSHSLFKTNMLEHKVFHRCTWYQDAFGRRSVIYTVVVSSDRRLFVLYTRVKREAECWEEHTPHWVGLEEPWPLQRLVWDGGRWWGSSDLFPEVEPEEHWPLQKPGHCSNHFWSEGAPRSLIGRAGGGEWDQGHLCLSAVAPIDLTLEKEQKMDGAKGERTIWNKID